MFTLEQFLIEGELIGTGSFKRCYKLEDYVCCVPRKDEDYWGIRAIESQINIWEDFKDDSNKLKLLAPILDYDIDFSRGTAYYIQPYCDRPFDKELPLFKVLNFNDVYPIIDDNCSHYPIVGDLVRYDNQGLLNGNTVIFDWGLTKEDYAQWKLDIEGLELSSFQELGEGKLINFAYIGFYECACIKSHKENEKLILDYISVQEEFLETEVEDLILDELFDNYDVIDNRNKQAIAYKKAQNIDFKGMSLF